MSSFFAGAGAVEVVEFAGDDAGAEFAGELVVVLVLTLAVQPMLVPINNAARIVSKADGCRFFNFNLLV